jgi:MerR family mercuric resistance operon transcriptional regulator
MRRSELARSAGCHSETVRFYETRGLLPEPPRNAAGHRVYERERARRLRFIVRARELGFSLPQITQLLRLADDGGSICAEAKALTLGRLDETRRKLADLCELEQALAAMVARCDHDEPGTCPIIDTLSERSSAA